MFLLVGKAFHSFFNELGILVRLAGVVWSMTIRRKIHWRNTNDQLVHLGFNSLVIVVTTAFFIGMVFSLQITKEFLKYGAGSVVGGVVAIALWRELAPVLTAVIIAGRVGSAITAELGTMQVTEQVDAISSFGIDPVYYLVAPKVLAMTLMLPILVGLFDLIGLFGSYLISVKVMDLNSVVFINSVNQISRFSDLIGGIVKAVVFGMTIALIACRQGLQTQGGALGVGMATTRSVVISLLAIFVLNYFLSLLLF